MTKTGPVMRHFVIERWISCSGLSAKSHYKIAGTRARHTHPSDYKRLEQLIHHKRIIYGGGGGSHPRCQTRGPTPAAKKHVRDLDLDFTKNMLQKYAPIAKATRRLRGLRQYQNLSV